jgi:hypothetical protein
MNKEITPDLREVMEAVHYRPAVSIILPFESKMNLKKVMTQELKSAADKVERELKENYPVGLATPVIIKLRDMVSNLQFDTNKKSVAIFLSPVFEKVLFLDIAVEAKIIIDESFEIRDLVYCKKQLSKYLVLQLSGNESRMYLGDAVSLIRIITGTSESVNDFINDTPERISNFSDLSERKDIVLKKFLQHTDNTLDNILNTYHLPLFVIGPERITGHFKKLTKHAGAVIEYITGNFEETALPGLKKVIGPHIANWNKMKQNDLMNQVEDAAGKKKLAAGIKEVWREAMNHKGRLLVVEKNYMYAAEHGSREEVIYKAKEPYNKYSYIRDAVDDVIEKVLETGGDVEFVDENVLNDYDHIALIQYY